MNGTCASSGLARLRDLRVAIGGRRGLLYENPVERTLTIEARFCGPPGAANGGYLAGRLAAFVEGEAEVTLHRATPLRRRLRVLVNEHGADLYDGDALTAQARRTSVVVDPRDPISLSQAQAATRRFPRFDNHPLPRDFACGVERAPGDGLRIFPGPVTGREEIWAAPWTPDASLADDHGGVRREFLWAALDSAGAFAVNEPPRGLALLGRLAARIIAPVEVGETVVVAAWPLSREGRKLQPATAVYSAGGELRAIARATWILT